MSLRRTHLWLLCAVIQVLVGCALADILALNPEKPKRRTGGPPTDAPSPTPNAPKETPLAPIPLARRLAIELGLQLPQTADIDTLVADANKLSLLVDTYLAGSASSLALARMHPRMWGMSDDAIPELERLIDLGDAGLDTDLTAALRSQLIEEPVLRVRHVLDHEQPYSALFTTDYAVVAADAATFWGLTDDGTPWSGEPYRYATYDDGRPAAGLLAGPMLLASYPAAADAEHLPRARAMLQQLACQPFENRQAHLFYTLTADELAGDLRELARTKSPCVTCHGQFHGIGAAFTGLGTGDTFAAWTAYSDPGTAATGFYAGQPFTGLADLAAQVGDDPRVHRCTVERLLAQVYQRPLNGRDRTTVARALDQFYAGNQDLKGAARKIFQAEAFALAPIAPKIIGDALYEASGVRILRRAHWQALIEQLAPGATAVEFPAELEPGSEESTSSSWMIPAGAYWHAVDRLARQAATAIVEAELSEDSTAVTRRVFTELPDGDGTDADDSAAYAQIQALWRKITGEELPDSSSTYADFQTLWTDAKSGTDAASVHRAWRTVLVAMLTHPKVITY